MGFRQIAVTLLRRFAYSKWIEELNSKELLPEWLKLENLENKEPLSGPSNHLSPPALPGQIEELDHIDLAKLDGSPDLALSLDVMNRIGDFQQGALVLQWEALPFYYEHRLLLVAQSLTVASESNAITQKDFEYRAPEAMGVTVEGKKLEQVQIPPDSGTTSINSRCIQIPLRNLWDSLPEIAQQRWALEKPTNRGNQSSNQYQLSVLPDLDVVYQIVERFSGNIEVQAEIFYQRNPDTPDKNGYQVRQLGQRFVAVLNPLQPQLPKTPQADYLLTAGLIQITDTDLQGQYKAEYLEEPTKSKVKLTPGAPNTKTRLRVVNELTDEDRRNIHAIAVNQSGETFDSDNKTLTAIVEAWYCQEAISSRPSQEIPDLPVDFPDSTNTINLATIVNASANAQNSLSAR